MIFYVNHFESILLCLKIHFVVTLLPEDQKTKYSHLSVVCNVSNITGAMLTFSWPEWQELWALQILRTMVANQTHSPEYKGLGTNY